MRYLFLILCLFIYSCDSGSSNPSGIDTDVSVYGTWQYEYKSNGYYSIDGESQSCEPVQFLYNQWFTDPNFNTTSYYNIQILQNSISVHRYVEFHGIAQEQCNNSSLMTGVTEFSFVNGICFSDFIGTYSYTLNDIYFGILDDDEVVGRLYYYINNDNLVLWNYDYDECSEEDLFEDPVGTMTGNDDSSLCDYQCYFDTYTTDDIDDIQCLDLGGNWSFSCEKDYFIKINDSEF